MFTNRISIRVERNLVTFTKQSRSVSLVPYVHLADRTDIVSVGEPPTGQEHSVRIDLFSEPQVPIDYGDVLAAFLRHGIATLLGQHPFQLRPSIDFAVSDEVAVFLRRYHKAILSDAATRAGANADATTFSSSTVA